MNSRLLQLIEESNLITVSDVYQEELKKFAQLIVNDCVEVAKNIQRQVISNGSRDYVTGRDMGIEVAVNSIKRHFEYDL